MQLCLWLQAVQLLLSKGAAVGAADAWGNTAVTEAERFAGSESLLHVLERAAEVTQGGVSSAPSSPLCPGLHHPQRGHCHGQLSRAARVAGQPWPRAAAVC